MAGRALNAVSRATRKPKWVEKAWRDMVRKAACERDAEGNQYMFAVARTLVRLAAAGDVSAIKEFGDRIDGRVNPGKEGSGETTLNFVVALPAVAPAEKWGASWNQTGEGARLINASLPAQHSGNGPNSAPAEHRPEDEPRQPITHHRSPAQPTPNRMRDDHLRPNAADAERHNDKETSAAMLGVSDKGHDAQHEPSDGIQDGVGKEAEGDAWTLGNGSAVGHGHTVAGVEGASRGGEGVSASKSDAPDQPQPAQASGQQAGQPTQGTEQASAFGDLSNIVDAGASNVVTFPKPNKDDG